MTDTAVRADAPPPPVRRRGPGTVLLDAWRSFTSMRTALVLLFALGVVAVPGSLLPQRGLNASKVTQFYSDHPHLAPVLDHLWLFDVFASPWFAAVYLALFASLAGCVVPRLWRQARALRVRPPAPPRHLDRLPLRATWATGDSPEAVAAQARAALRGWRVDTHPGPDGELALAAERGYLKEIGNLLFHSSLLLLLLGVALGGMFGYKGSVLVVEGDGFSNSLVSYDEFHPGRFFSAGELSPFTVVLHRFRATYTASGEPATFDAYISAATPGTSARRDDLKVNSPLGVGGTDLYLTGHGYAPTFTVRVPGVDHPVFRGAVPFLARDSSFASDGVIKVPDVPAAKDGTARQLAFTGFFAPTTIMTTTGLASGYPAARNPTVTLLAWRGDLGIDGGAAQSVYQLDTRHMKRIRTAAGKPATRTLRRGQSMRLADGTTITFTGLRQYATLQVNHDPGKKPALAAAVLIVTGLILSLFVRRRRLWLRARPDGTRTVVSVGGLGRGDAAAFAPEFARFTGRLHAPPRED